MTRTAGSEPSTILSRCTDAIRYADKFITNRKGVPGRGYGLRSSVPRLLIILLTLTPRIPALYPTSHRPTSLLAKILLHNALHTAHIMPWLSHKVQFRSPGPASLLALHDFYPLDIWAVDFEPHLHSYTRQLVA
jgi:hypothetical protein